MRGCFLSQVPATARNSNGGENENPADSSGIEIRLPWMHYPNLPAVGACRHVGKRGVRRAIHWQGAGKT